MNSNDVNEMKSNKVEEHDKGWKSIFKKGFHAENTESLGLVILTIVVDCKRDVGRDDVVETDLAVLRWAVGVQSLHAHDAIKKATLGDRCLVTPLDEHRGELVHVIHTHVHRGPVGGGKGEIKMNRGVEKEK